MPSEHFLSSLIALQFKQLPKVLLRKPDGISQETAGSLTVK